MIATSAEDAARYYCEEEKLAKEDYYLKGQDPPGQWYGGESLGLSGEVQSGDFASILKGEDPATGRMLVRRGGRDHKHHPGWDFTFSAPKSVSVAYARSDEPMKSRILDAHNRAVKAAMDYLKEDILSSASVRVRNENGARKEYREKPKDIVAACFNHQTSRELDPQIHTHCVVANVAQREDLSWGTLKVKQAFVAKKAVGAAYRVELANILSKDLGIAVEKDREYFRVQVVPKELESDFSKRRKQILSQMKKEGLSGGKQAAKATVKTRANKHGFDHSVLDRAWQKEMDRDGFTYGVFRDKNLSAEQKNQGEKILKGEVRKDYILESLKDLSQQASTFSREKIAQKAFESAQGEKSLREMREELKRIEGHQETVRLNRADKSVLYTTKELQAIEAQMLSHALFLSKDKYRGLDHKKIKDQIRVYESEKSHEVGFEARLTPDQAKAVDYALGDSRLALIEGIAGAGKSFAMGAVRHVYESAGFNVRGFAPTGIAAQNLSESGIKSMTLDKFFHSKDSLSDKDVVICDEMGMVGSRKAARLLKEVRESGAKLIMVGESRQLQPVDAGGAFRVIGHVVEKESITQIFRQKKSWQRDAVELFRAGDSKSALDLYDRNGALRVAESETGLKKEVVKEYLQYHRESPGKSQVVVSRNNEAVADLNQSIRVALQNHGHIEKTNFKAVIENRIGQVEKEFSRGDKIVFLKNDSKLGVLNGNMGEVKKITPDARGGVRYLHVKADGKDVKVDLFNYNKLDHAYAVTIHKSQGSTLDRVLVHGNQNMDRESTYVANSRQKEDVLLFCSLAQFGKDLSVAYEPFRNKDEVIKEVLKPELTKSFDKSVQKDTSLDYTALEPLATRRLKELGDSLKPEATKEQVRIIAEIAATQGAAKTLLADPSPAPWMENARDILKTGSFRKSVDLKAYISSLNTGYDPVETNRFVHRKSDLEHSASSLAGDQLQKLEAELSKKEAERSAEKENKPEVDKGMSL